MGRTIQHCLALMLLPVVMFGATHDWTNQANATGYSAGDTVRLWGIWGTNLVVTNSGTAGNPITFSFQSGAKFSKGTWNQGTDNGDAAIYGTGKSFITIDGNNNGVNIECTNNGTGLLTSNHCVGVQFNSSHHITVQNLAVTNMYVRTYGTENNAVGGCIQFRNGNNDSITVSNCSVWHANVPIYFTYSNGDTNLEIVNCTGGHSGEGVVVLATQTSTGTLSNAWIHGNTFSMSNSWSGQAAIHKNCMHLHSVGSSSRIDGMKVYNNTVTGEQNDNSTSFIFLEGLIYDALVYNNLFLGGSTLSGNGMLVLKVGSNTLVANNTFYGLAVGGTAIGTTSYSASDPTSTRVYNNLIFHFSGGISDTIRIISDSDFNVWHGVTIFVDEVGQRNFAGWQGYTGFDSNSTTSEPALSATYVPTAADTVVRDKGTNLSSFFTTDKNGNTRVGTWDIGAYEYVAPDLTRTMSVSGTMRVGVLVKKP